MTPSGEELVTSERQRLRCFVIGPIGNRFANPGTDERGNYEEAIQVLEEVILPACNSVGLTPIRAVWFDPCRGNNRADISAATG